MTEEELVINFRITPNIRPPHQEFGRALLTKFYDHYHLDEKGDHLETYFLRGNGRQTLLEWLYRQYGLRATTFDFVNTTMTSMGYGLVIQVDQSLTTTMLRFKG